MQNKNNKGWYLLFTAPLIINFFDCSGYSICHWNILFLF